MQPMPAKTRAAVAVGVALLAIAVASMVMFSSRREARPTPSDMEEAWLMEEPSTPLETAPSPATTQTPTPDSSLATESGGSAGTVLTAVPDYHIVGAGDTLMSISRKYYGDHVFAGDIEAMNNLSDPNRLEMGQKLMLPRPEALGGAGN